MEPLGEAVINDMLITVARFREPWEAHMLRGRLEAEGIPASVAHEFVIAVDWLLSNAIGGVRVQVPLSCTEDAKEIEAGCRNGKYKSELQAELGDLDDVCCPRCGSAHFSKRRTISQIIFGVFFALFGLPLPGTWICVCEKCGAKFKYGSSPRIIG